MRLERSACRAVADDPLRAGQVEAQEILQTLLDRDSSGIEKNRPFLGPRFAQVVATALDELDRTSIPVAATIAACGSPIEGGAIFRFAATGVG